MQTPKARTNSSGVLQRTSPRSIPSSEISQKISPRVVRQLKTSPRYSDPTASSSNLATRAPKERSPKVSDRRSPRSPVGERKCPSRVAELESQVSQLENDLKIVKDQLCSSEIAKNRAHEDAEESKRQLLALSAKQQSYDSAALASALDELKQLKVDLETVAESEANLAKQSKSAQIELQKLKDNLEETLSVVEDMKNELRDSKKSEALAQGLVSDTLMQLETAKMTVETLRSDGCKATEAYDAIAFELEQSRARVKFLEELVEQIKSAAGQREAELEAELRKSKYEIEELKANLMDKETELQGICEENDSLIMQLENTVSSKREQELENELKKMNDERENLTARLMDKETELHHVLNENETLKLEIKKGDEIVSDLEAARTVEREALVKVSYMREEVDKSNRKVDRVTEQLEAAQASNAEMEAELRRLKVQSDQWRKAAEAAATMLSAGNNGQLMERTGSMDSIYSPRRTRRVSSPYADDLDEDSLKKKNGNMLRRFGVLWKKPQK